MRLLLLLLLSVAFVGCSSDDATDSTTPATTPDSGETTDGDANASTSEAPDAITVSFTAGESATLAVPEMSCPFACYPKVKETLEGLDGVTAVELVPQKEEGVIDDRRVTVSFDSEVDGAAAVAALDKAGFPGAKFE